MSTHALSGAWRCEVLVKGRWVLASRGWTEIERDAFLRSGDQRADVRFVRGREGQGGHNAE